MMYLAWVIFRMDIMSSGVTNVDISAIRLKDFRSYWALPVHYLLNEVKIALNTPRSGILDINYSLSAESRYLLHQVVNSPQLLRSREPTFTNAVFSHMQRTPTFLMCELLCWNLIYYVDVIGLLGIWRISRIISQSVPNLGCSFTPNSWFGTYQLVLSGSNSSNWFHSMVQPELTCFLTS